MRCNWKRFSTFSGLPALSLDALTSVAYGPEAIMVVLATASVGALRHGPVIIEYRLYMCRKVQKSESSPTLRQ
ncbi:hypothetical protein [Ferrimicrobium sp.]|uniref:hypothetical protein n=1 Tax=Ferrimicrobium sp. TaxID=2926050 RepID=UPI00261E8D69|nr:hypothetical protein [Ferrimicrobium sp.]